MKGSKKDRLLYELKTQFRARLKPHENELDIGGTKSYLSYLNSLLSMHSLKVNRNIIQREIDIHIDKLRHLDKSMKHVGIYLSDIGRWLDLEGYAKGENLEIYISEISKYSGILIENAQSRKKTALGA